MIQCIFTLDYEIFGSGKGTLTEHVLEPANALAEVFLASGRRFVVFPEVAELEAISSTSADPHSDQVAPQLRRFRDQGFEIGLHFHPWWYNAQRARGEWRLDYAEYNLCVLPRSLIAARIERALAFLRGLLRDPGFTPCAYRAGHLLMQPAAAVVEALTSRGIGVDSSLFKGGYWREHGQDYRAALANPPMWRFDDDPNVPHPHGRMIEIPVHAEMVPTWRMLTGKRMSLERRSAAVSRSGRRILDRLRNVRLTRAVKFDYCVLSADELTAMLDAARRQDVQDPAVLRPLVAIGHTKDLTDLETVKRLLGYLDKHSIPDSGFEPFCVAARSACSREARVS